MPKFIGVIQARMSSTRLPGKLLGPVAGRPLIAVLFDRVRDARVDEWWMATTDERTDDVTAAWGVAMGLEVFRGDREDVLSRFAEIAVLRRPDWIVRLTADNPFVDAGIIDALVGGAETAAQTIQHVGEGHARQLPLGFVPEVVRGDAIITLNRLDLPAHDRAHVTSRIREGPASQAAAIDPSWPRRPAWRWTVDTPADLAMADAAFRAFGSTGASIDYRGMVARLDACPEITAMNADVRQKDVVHG